MNSYFLRWVFLIKEHLRYHQDFYLKDKQSNQMYNISHFELYMFSVYKYPKKDDSVRSFIFKNKPSFTSYMQVKWTNTVNDWKEERPFDVHMSTAGYSFRTTWAYSRLPYPICNSERAAVVVLGDINPPFPGDTIAIF